MFVDRMDRSITVARHMAAKLDIDLFDDHRRGRFRQIVQNCLVCERNRECVQTLGDPSRLEEPPHRCRNAEFFKRED